jgi:hypothetical protein
VTQRRFLPAGHRHAMPKLKAARAVVLSLLDGSSFEFW